MNNTIPFHSAPHAPQITVDVNILSALKQAASRLSKMASENVYLAAIGPDMDLTIIMEEDAPSVLPCFDEGDALISVKGAPLFISYNPAQVLKLAGKRYLTGPVIFYRTDGRSTIVFPDLLLPMCWTRTLPRRCAGRLHCKHNRSLRNVCRNGALRFWMRLFPNR